MLFTIKIMGVSGFNFPLNQSIDEQIPSWWDSEATTSEPWKDSWKYSFYVVFAELKKTLLSKSQFFTIPYYSQFQAAKLLKKRWKNHDMENLSETPWKAVVPSNHPTLLPGKRGRVQPTPQNLRIAPERFLPVLPVEVLDAFMTLGSKWKNPKKCLDFRQKLLLTVTQSAEYVVCKYSMFVLHTLSWISRRLWTPGFPDVKLYLSWVPCTPTSFIIPPVPSSSLLGFRSPASSRVDSSTSKADEGRGTKMSLVAETWWIMIQLYHHYPPLS